MTFNSSLGPGPAVLLGRELISRPGLHSPCKRNQNRDKRYSEFRDDVTGVLKCIKLGSGASCRDTKHPVSAILYFWARISRSFASEHRVYPKASCFNKLLLWR